MKQQSRLRQKNSRRRSAPHKEVRCGSIPVYNLWAVLREDSMTTDALLKALLDEAYSKKTWHGPNLRQSLKGVSAKQAAWRPGRGRHNIWEIALHAAYWKYAVRRKLERGKRGSFVLKGSNFFTRPENGNASEPAWRADRAILETEHRELEKAI